MDNMGNGKVLHQMDQRKFLLYPKHVGNLGQTMVVDGSTSLYTQSQLQRWGLMSMGLIPTHQAHIALGHGVVYLVVCGGLLDSCVFFYTRGFDRSQQSQNRQISWFPSKVSGKTTMNDQTNWCIGGCQFTSAAARGSLAGFKIQKFSTQDDDLLHLGTRKALSLIGSCRCSFASCLPILATGTCDPPTGMLQHKFTLPMPQTTMEPPMDPKHAVRSF